MVTSNGRAYTNTGRMIKFFLCLTKYHAMKTYPLLNIKFLYRSDRIENNIISR